MEPDMFIVKHGQTCYGPFRSHETAAFVSTLDGPAEVIPLVVPAMPDEHRGPMELRVLDDEPYRAFVDGFKVDTKHTLGGIVQECYFARREARVFTVRELRETWDQLCRVSYAVESLMHYADAAVADPQPKQIAALRKAIWRNRDSDDFDPHYADRFW